MLVWKRRHGLLLVGVFSGTTGAFTVSFSQVRERQLSLFYYFLNGVKLGFNSDSQAIEAALGCVQCSSILFTGKVV